MPIPGTTRLDHLTENLGACRVQLSSADMNEVEDIVTRNGVAGARFPEKVLELSDTGAVLGTSSRGGHGKTPLRTQIGR